MSQFLCSTFVPGTLNSVYFSSVLFLFVSDVDDNESLKDEKYTKIKGGESLRDDMVSFSGIHTCPGPPQ